LGAENQGEKERQRTGEQKKLKAEEFSSQGEGHSEPFGKKGSVMATRMGKRLKSEKRKIAGGLQRSQVS